MWGGLGSSGLMIVGCEMRRVLEKRSDFFYHSSLVCVSDVDLWNIQGATEGQVIMEVVRSLNNNRSRDVVRMTTNYYRDKNGGTPKWHLGGDHCLSHYYSDNNNI
jgi:hypothetical protein